MNHNYPNRNVDNDELLTAHAKTRAQQAEIRTEQAKTRTEQAETRTEQAETRTEQARTRTEQAETRIEQAETRTEQAEMRVEQAKARTEQAEVRTEEAETRSEAAIRASEVKFRLLSAELEQRVIERTAQLQACNKDLDAFSYSVSHDLRSPLRHIQGFIDILKKEAGPALSEKSLNCVAVIDQSAKKMGTMIDALLAFAHIGQSELKKVEVNLNVLVRETLDDFQEAIEARKIAVEIHPLPAVQADRALLQMVLVNLIANAVKFTAGRAEAKIEIDSTAGNGETTVFIRDNGAGFDPQYAGKLFGVFQRLHRQEEFEGTGIGLANVQRIINRHGGRVWAEGAVNVGATFYFSIPMGRTKKG